MRPRDVGAPYTFTGGEEPPETLAGLQSIATDTEAIAQAIEDRQHHAGMLLHGAGVLYGLRASGSTLSIAISGGRISAGGTYSESGASIESVAVPDDATTYIWVRGAAYTTSAGADAATLVFDTSTSPTSAPDSDHEWVLLAQVVASGGASTVTNHPAGAAYCDWVLGRYVRAYNGSGGAIARGDACYMAGTQQDSTNLQLVPDVAIADGNDVAKLPVLGIACTDIANGAYGYVQWLGAFPEHPDSSGWSNGDRIWLGDAGALVNAQPAHGGAYVGVWDGAVPSGVGTLWIGPLRTCGDLRGTAQTSFSVGPGTDVTLSIYANNADASKPGLRYNASTNQWEYSNDGSAWNAMGSGGGSGTPSDTVVEETAYGMASDPGDASEYSRGNHTHGTPPLSSDDPEDVVAGASASAGTSTDAAHADHVHALATAAPSGGLGTANAEGTATTSSRSDHTHLAYDATLPANVGSVASAGTASTSARRDHVHNGLRSIARVGESGITGDATLEAGSGITLTQSGSKITITNSGGGGGSGTPADSVTSETAFGQAGSAGSSTDYSRGDHTHGTPDEPSHGFCLVVTDADTAAEIGNGTIGFAAPYSLDGCNITRVCVSVDTAGGTSGSLTIMLRRRRAGSNADVLSSALALAYNGYVAYTTSIDSACDDIEEGDRYYVDVDGIPSGGAPTGVSVAITCERT